jgi:two-component SAPR family response regulator
MRERDNKYSVLVVDSDDGFLNRITSILNDIIKDHKEITVFPRSESENIEELVNNKVDLAFLDDKVVTDENLLAEIHESNPNCFFVLLVSVEGGQRIKDVIKNFKKKSNIFMSAYLLKDNYSDNILQMFCKMFLDNIIPEFRLRTNEQKNLILV